MSRAVVIGAGPAGVMAAARASINGHETILIEKNEKLGKKLYITGKGRCNVTNAAELPGFFECILRNPKFCYSALYSFSNSDLRDLLSSFGTHTKVERGGRVFPVSDKSSDVNAALKKYIANAGVKVMLNTSVDEIQIDDGVVRAVVADGTEIACDAVVVATGGLSYPLTGSTGDGYEFARTVGHTISQTQPSLVPLETVDSWPAKCQGVSLRNVELSAYVNGKLKYREQGEMLFTHFGVSGPLVLSASCYYEPDKIMTLSIDLKPALSEEMIDARLQREISAAGKKQYKSMLANLLPAKMIPVFEELTGIPGDCPVTQITRLQRQKIGSLLKGLKAEVSRTRPISEAIITRGGIAVSQINSSTMESKLINGLYFAGEVIDIDAFTGGYNLQLAFSTGYLAGNSIK